MIVSPVLLLLVAIFNLLRVILVIIVINQFILYRTQIILLVNRFSLLLLECFVVAGSDVAPAVHLQLDKAIVEPGVCV